MRGWLLILLIFMLALPAVFPLCNETQIDINSASIEELDKIATIGPATAEKIILMRPFSSVDELIDVNGIGEKTIAKIKAQGLACVTSENPSGGNNVSTFENEAGKNISYTSDSPGNNSEPFSITPPPSWNSVTSEAIVLNEHSENTKDIKTNANPLSSDKIALYGLVAFGLVIAVLLATKRLKNRKTEFDEEPNAKEII